MLLRTILSSFSFIIVLLIKNFKPFFTRSYQTPRINSIKTQPIFKLSKSKTTSNTTKVIIHLKGKPLLVTNKSSYSSNQNPRTIKKNYNQT